MSGNVVLSQTATGAKVTIDSILAASVTDAEVFQIFTGAGDDDLTGGALGDNLSAYTGANVLSGGSGDDTLSLAIDNEVDTVNGGSGIDRLNISLSDFNQTLTVAPAGGSGVSVKVGAGNLVSASGIESIGVTGGGGKDKITGLDGNDQLSGSSNTDTLKGGNGDDSMNGGVDNDVLNGGAGNDTIAGDFGDDDLAGAGGADQFRFYSPLHGVDTVKDFTAQDSIGIVAGGAFGTFSLPLVAGSPVDFISGANPVVPVDSIGPVFLYDTDTGEFSVDRDGAGVGAAQVLAILEDGDAPATLVAGQITVF